MENSTSLFLQRISSCELNGIRKIATEEENKSSHHFSGRQEDSGEQQQQHQGGGVGGLELLSGPPGEGQRFLLQVRHLARLLS